MHYLNGVWTAMCLALLAASTSGCSSKPAPAPELGQAKLSLTGTSTGGLKYRLRDAEIVIARPDGTIAATRTTETRPDFIALLVDLPPGDYFLELREGWRLERADGADSWEDVEATLSSVNPQAFIIQRDQTTNIALRFRVEGGDVELGEGRAEITIEVDDSQPEQDCEEACRDALECSTSQGCTLLCAFTPERCRAEADEVIACVAASPDGDWTCDAITLPDDCQEEFEALNDCI